ncbi:MAG TPA: DUF1552 domain-containing protein [Polyangia bacterium]
MATGAAAAWQWTRPRRAQAAGAPTRLIILPMLNGAEARHFWPAPGNLSVITEPLRAYQSQLTFVKGVNIDGSNNHMAVRSMFTGATIPDYLSPDPTNKSIDQIVADQIAATAPTRLRSLHLGVIPADSIDFYQRYGRSTFFFSPKPVDYEANPVSAFDRTFKGLSGPTVGGGGTTPPPTGGGGTTPPAAPTDFEKDVLDISDAELNELGKRVGGMPGELAKVEQHRLAIKTLRAGLVTTPGSTPAPGDPMPMTPSAPMGGTVMCDTTPLASVEKLRPALAGQDREAYKHQYFSDIFDAQVDIAVRALVCGVTRVATIQAGSADGNPTDPVGGGLPHHNTSHGNQDTFAMCQQWYMTKFGRLIKGLDVKDPLDPAGKTVLHNSVILIMSECLPVSHGSDGVPVLIAGGGSGLIKPGQIIEAGGATNKALMATLLQVFGASSGGGHFGTTTIGGLRA